MTDDVPTMTLYTYPTTGPSSSFRALFLYDTTHPVSVVASVIAATSSSTEYLVTCPSSCPSSSFPEQTVTHQSGSLWEGRRTWDGTTTQWLCRLGNSGRDVLEDQNGNCWDITHTGDGPVTTPAPTPVDTCFVYARSVPAHITAGMGKIYKYQPYYKENDPEMFTSALSEAMESLGCPTIGSKTEKTVAETGTGTVTETGTGTVTETATEAGEVESGAASAVETVEATSTSNGARMSKSLVLLGVSMFLGVLIRV